MNEARNRRAMCDVSRGMVVNMCNVLNLNLSQGWYAEMIGMDNIGKGREMGGLQQG